MELEGLGILVIGMGKTGIESARFLAGKCRNLLVTDAKPRSEWEGNLREIVGAPLSYVDYSADALSQADLVIPSPGVPPSSPLLLEAVARGIPVLSELELAFRFLKTPVIAITGTNGKTTTTTLTGEILRAAHKKVFVGGNIGSPLIGYAGGRQDADYAVVEVSSFQLQWVKTFRPVVSVLLNITCDHVDYHGSFADYRKAKERIFENQEGDDLAVLNFDEESGTGLADRIKARVSCFSSTQVLNGGIFPENDSIIFKSGKNGIERYPLSMIKIPGRHNVENVMASIVAAKYCGCSSQDIIRAIDGFKGIPHRIEYAGEKQGVLFYDDSKGTNVGAVARALETFSSPVVLLMGGRDKDGDFETLAAPVREKVAELVLFGEARGKINERIGGIVRTSQAATMKEAVGIAYRHASPGYVVLLSPGCASFDEFRDYKERGCVFKETIGKL